MHGAKIQICFLFRKMCRCVGVCYFILLNSISVQFKGWIILWRGPLLMWFRTIGLPAEKYVNWSEYNYLLTLCLGANGKIWSETRRRSVRVNWVEQPVTPRGWSPPAHHLNSIFLKYFHNNSRQNTANTRDTWRAEIPKYKNKSTFCWWWWWWYTEITKPTQYVTRWLLETEQKIGCWIVFLIM